MVRAASAICCLAFAASLSGAGHKLVFLGDLGGPAHAGFEFGAAEAVLQGEFLDVEYHLETGEPASAANHKDAAAVFIAADPKSILAAADALAAANVPVFNVSSSDDALRAQCRANLFHIPPSNRMAADAVNQWKQVNPEARQVEAYAWHEEFAKFAGRELNRRWREAHGGKPMNDANWAAWAAVKLLGDAIVNNPGADAGELLDYLREEAEFDGQKGATMMFRETGQLGQPLLIVSDGALAGEAPVRGAADPDDLDSLGPQECKP